MESSETYNNLIQVRKISQLTNINDFSNYDDEDILFVIAAHDKTLGKWANFSVNKGVLINLLNQINLDAIRQEIDTLRELLDVIKGEVSGYQALITRIEYLENRVNEFYTAAHINELISNYYTKEEADNKFQTKGNYLTEHPNTGSTGHTMKIPEGHYISGITFDDYGHVINIETTLLDQTPKIVPTSLTVTGYGLSKNAIYLGESLPTVNPGTVTVTYSNGTSKTVDNYTYSDNLSAVDINQSGTHTITGNYQYVEDGVTVNTEVTTTLTIGQLDSIDVTGYGFSKTTFGINDSLVWKKGTVTAKYTNGLADKPVTSNTTITSYSSSDTNVINVNGTTFTIVGSGVATISATYEYTDTEAGITKTVTKTQQITVEEFYIYVGPEEITSEWETNDGESTSTTVPAGEPITNIGWTKLPGKASEIKINVMNDSIVNWCVAIPKSFGITNVTDAGEPLGGYTTKVVTTKDGVEYNIWIQDDETMKFNYIMK